MCNKLAHTSLVLLYRVLEMISLYDSVSSSTTPICYVFSYIFPFLQVFIFYIPFVALLLFICAAKDVSEQTPHTSEGHLSFSEDLYFLCVKFCFSLSAELYVCLFFLFVVRQFRGFMTHSCLSYVQQRTHASKLRAHRHRKYTGVANGLAIQLGVGVACRLHLQFADELAGWFTDELSAGVECRSIPTDAIRRDGDESSVGLRCTFSGTLDATP